MGQYHREMGQVSVPSVHGSGRPRRRSQTIGPLERDRAARVLGVARHTLSRVLNGHAAISPEMAIRLEKAGWSNAEFWLHRQTTFDLAQAPKREHQINVARYEPRPAVSG